MISHQYIWLILLLPLFAFIINGIVLRLFFKRDSKIYGYVTVTAIGDVEYRHANERINGPCRGAVGKRCSAAGTVVCTLKIIAIAGFELHDRTVANREMRAVLEQDAANRAIERADDTTAFDHTVRQRVSR